MVNLTILSQIWYHALSVLEVLRVLDEAEAHERLVAGAQAVARHRQDRRRLPDTAAVHCTTDI